MNFLFCINNQYCDTIKVLIHSLVTHNQGKHHFYFIYNNISEKNKQILIDYTHSKKGGGQAILSSTYKCNFLGADNKQ